MKNVTITIDELQGALIDELQAALEEHRAVIKDLEARLLNQEERIRDLQRVNSYFSK